MSSLRPFRPNKLIGLFYKNTSLWRVPALWLLIYLVSFVILSLPLRTLIFDTVKVVNSKTIGYSAFYDAEKDDKGNSFTWSRPDAQLWFPDVPRYAPLKFTIKLNLNRPAGSPQAHLTFNELRGQQRILLGTVDYHNNPDYSDYTFTIPACPACYHGAIVEIGVNSFRPAGEARSLGVIVVQYRVSLGPTHLRYLFWPQPYLLVVLLLGLGLVGWFTLMGLNFWWGSGLLPVITLYLTSLQNDIIGQWPWLLFFAGGLCLTTLAGRYLTRVGLRWWFMAGVIFLVAFFCVSPPSPTDMKISLQWIADLHTNPTGPFDIYRASPRLNYPPLIAYILWFYQLAVGWLGLAGSDVALKFFYSLSLPLTVWLLWTHLDKLSYRLNRSPHEAVESDSAASWPRPALILSVFGASLLFDPASWGQTDTVLTLMLLATLICINRRWYWFAGILLWLDLLFKPQAWLIAPYFAFLLFLRLGWWKALKGGLAGFGLALLLGLPAFGFDLTYLPNLLFQPGLAGSVDQRTPTASGFNLMYVLGYSRTDPPTWLTYASLALIGLLFIVMSGLSWLLRHHVQDRLEEFCWDSLVSALLVSGFFLFELKMRERFLVYGIFFLAMAALRYRRVVPVYLLFNAVSLINMLVYFRAAPRDYFLDTFFVWRELIAEPVIPYVVAGLTTAGFGWLLYNFVYYFRATRSTNPVVESHSLPVEVQSLY